MSLALYMDQHVRRAITVGVRRRGLDVITAYDDNRSAASDPDLLLRATELGRVLFTHDTDFLVITGDFQRLGQPFGGVIYAHKWNITIGKAVSDLELAAKALEPHEMANVLMHIPL